MFHLSVMLGTSLVLIEAVMLIFWCYYLIRRNVSVIDIGWGIGFIIAAAVYLILGNGYCWRKILVLTIVTIWALRLVKYLCHRFLPEKEDPRYELLLTKWPFSGYPHFQVLTLFAFQGFLITLLSLPFALMDQNVFPYFSTFEVFGLLIWMGGLVGEAVADWQLDQFKQNPAMVGQVCDQGLWKHSRHPNYFFEWVIWLGLGLMALSAPYGWLGLISPVLMLVLLVKISGIPLVEEQALKSKGEAYHDYQTRTSAFFPWFSKK